jgi:hypothetical protein
MSYAFYYSVATFLAAYVAMVVLGWLMHRHVRRHLRGATNQQKQTLKLQRQLTRTLVIQASWLPAILCLTALANLIVIIF